MSIFFITLKIRKKLLPHFKTHCKFTHQLTHRHKYDTLHHQFQYNQPDSHFENDRIHLQTHSQLRRKKPFHLPQQTTNNHVKMKSQIFVLKHNSHKNFPVQTSQIKSQNHHTPTKTSTNSCLFFTTKPPNKQIIFNVHSQQKTTRQKSTQHNQHSSRKSQPNNSSTTKTNLSQQTQLVENKNKHHKSTTNISTNKQHTQPQTTPVSHTKTTPTTHIILQNNFSPQVLQQLQIKTIKTQTNQASHYPIEFVSVLT